MRPISLTLPFPPGVNHLYFTRVLPPKPPAHKKHYAIRVPTDELKLFKSQVANICRQRHIRPLVGDVIVTLHIFRPRRIGDTDGWIKSTLDALSGFAYIDDKQVDVLHVYRHLDKDNPRAEIRIEPIGLC